MLEQVELRPSLQPVSKELTLSQFLQETISQEILEGLNQREREVLTSHWLEGLSLDKIGRKLGRITRERVRQIEVKAWKKISSQLAENLQQELSKLLSSKRSQLMKNPEYRARMSQRVRVQWQDPEYRAKVSAAQRRRRERGKTAKAAVSTVSLLDQNQLL